MDITDNDWLRLGPKGIARITVHISQAVKDEVESGKFDQAKPAEAESDSAASTPQAEHAHVENPQSPGPDNKSKKDHTQLPKEPEAMELE